MEKRILGRTGLKVTVLGYGAMELRGTESWSGRPLTDEDADRLLNAVLDGGINFIDTSPDYGLSEERIGKSIAHRRGEYYLATKCGCNIPRPEDLDADSHVWTRDRLMQNIELSLRRMNTDYVDVWQMHNPSPDEVAAEDLTKVMEDVKRQGKTRHVAISSTLPHLDAHIDRGVFDTYQIPYSALQRQHEDQISKAANSGAGIIIRGGVGSGEPNQDLSSNERWRIWNKADLDELRSEDESRSAFLLRFTISHPHMNTTIVGTMNLEHLADNLKTVETGPLPDDVYAEAKRRLASGGQVPESV